MKKFLTIIMTALVAACVVAGCAAPMANVNEETSAEAVNTKKYHAPNLVAKFDAMYIGEVEQYKEGKRVMPADYEFVIYFRDGSNVVKEATSCTFARTKLSADDTMMYVWYEDDEVGKLVYPYPIHVKAKKKSQSTNGGSTATGGESSNQGGSSTPAGGQGGGNGSFTVESYVGGNAYGFYQGVNFSAHDVFEPSARALDENWNNMDVSWWLENPDEHEISMPRMQELFGFDYDRVLESRTEYFRELANAVYAERPAPGEDAPNEKARLKEANRIGSLDALSFYHEFLEGKPVSEWW